jgi:hypothetical protein
MAKVDPGNAATVLEGRRADKIIDQVSEKLPADMVHVGAGGELVFMTGGGAVAPFVNTVTQPDYVTADASHERLELAHEAGALEMALDVAATVAPQNSLERMLCHQLAVAHRLGMKFVALASDGLERTKAHGESPQLNAMIARNVGAAHRMMATFQGGMLALNRIRSGNCQTVRVEHVQVTNVGDGGQAVVANRIAGGRCRKRRGRGRK